MGVMDQQKGKAASQPKRGVQVIDPVLKRPDPSARPKSRLQRPPRPPQSSAQWPLSMDEDIAPLPAAKRARTGDMPPVPVRARSPLPGVAPADPEPILQPRKTGNADRLKRPSARSANGPPAAGSNGASSGAGLERLEQEVLGGRLWHAACRNLNEDLPESVPLSFADAAAYVGCFEPLLFEEARECIRSDWAEACEAFKPRTWPALISSLEDRAGGWTDVTVTPQPGGWDLLRPPQQGSLVILTSQQPPARQALDWLTRSQRERAHSRDSPDPPFGPGGGHRSRSPSPFPGGPTPSTSTADFQRQQMAEGLDGLEPAGPREAATAATAGPPQSAPKPRNNTAATEEARSVDGGSVAAAAGGDTAMMDSDTEEGQVGTVEASNGNVPGKAEGSSKEGQPLHSGAKRRRGREQVSQARGYSRRTASPEPSAYRGGNGRADGATEAPLIPSVIAGVVKSTSYRQDAGAGTFVISVHPCCSAHDMDACDGPCTKALEELRKKPSGWWGVVLSPLVTQTREYHTIHNLSKMPLVTSILHPERLKAIGESTLTMDAIRTLWPPELSGPKAPKFIDFLKHQYDHSQLEAIEMAACHLGPSAKSGPQQEGLPFLLIQGPPGTGKTHTVKGVLNVWHLTHFVRHYESTAAALTANAKAGASIDTMHGASDHRRKAAGKPRILICAPSNAAADELLQRIMDTGFRDANGGVYRPDVVRVGAEEAPLSQRARDVWVDGLIRKLMGLSHEEWRREFEQRRQEAMHLALRIREAQKHIRAADASQADVQKWGHDLASTHDAHHRAMLALKRLEEVQGLFSRTSSPKEVESNLELSFVEEAEMVFTTLSSTGRKIFQRLEGTPFHTVLIDEAAQASEIAALQPLIFGAKRAVLVGDPQQLPATVKSAKGKELELERSLFERLQRAGCPVKMLSVQYRMHPAIRQFPSDYFYGGRLEDGKSVREAAPPVFYEHPLLKPYRFFDVSHGREQRGGSNGGSLRNQAEADLAAAMYIELMAFRAACERRGAKLGACEVGIVTPYKQQKLCLRETFLRAAGPEASSKVMIETVDSFQGKQLDVIILSCVRASDRRSGVGFLADVRRMNVAITRAKQALWVLGSAATLERNPVWAALLANARERKCVVSEASARRLFPDQKPYKPPMSIPTQSAAAGAAAAGTQQQQQQQQHGGQVLVEPSSEASGQPQPSAGAAQLPREEGNAVQYMDLQPADILLPHVTQQQSTVSGQPTNHSSAQSADPRLRQQQQKQQQELQQAGSAGEQIQPAAEAQAPVDPRLKQPAPVPNDAQAQPAVAVQAAQAPLDPRLKQQQQHLISIQTEPRPGVRVAQMGSDPRLQNLQHQQMVSAEDQPHISADLQSTEGQGPADPRLRLSQQQPGVAVEVQQGLPSEAPMPSDTRLQQQQVQPLSRLADPRLSQSHRAASQAAAVQLHAPADPRAGPAAPPPAITDPRLRPNQAPVDPHAQPQRPSPITLQPPIASSGMALTAGHVNSNPPCLEQAPADFDRSGSAAGNSHTGHTSQAPADPRIQRQLPKPVTLQPPTSDGTHSSGGHVQGVPGPRPITLQPPTSSAGPHFSTAHVLAPPPITLQPPTPSGGAHLNATHVSGPLPITLQPPNSVSSTSASTHALPGPPLITLQPPGGLTGPSDTGGNGPGARPRLVTLRPPPMHAVPGVPHIAAEGMDMQQSGSEQQRTANGGVPHQRGQAMAGNGSVVRNVNEGSNGHQQGRAPKPITLRPPQQEQQFQAHTFQYKR